MNELRGLPENVNYKQFCRICLKSEPDVILRPATDLEIKQLIAVIEMPLESQFNVCMLCGHLLIKFYKFSYQCRLASMAFSKYEDKKPILMQPLYDLISTQVTVVTLSDPKHDDVFSDDDLPDDENDDDLPLSMLNKDDYQESEIHSMDVKKEQNEDEMITGAQHRGRRKKKKKNKRAKEKEIRKGFSSRMVQETEEYLVIKLTKQEVLEEMSERSKTEVYQRAPYKCSLCVKGYNFDDVLQKHMKKHSPENGCLQCSICYQYCPSTVSLRGHMKSHTTRYKCKVCSSVRLSRQHMLEHFTNTHTQDPVTYTCEHCTFVTNKRTVIQRHVRSHKPHSSHACHICGRRFKTIETLRVHSKRHDSANLVECPECNKRFIYESMLRRHVEAVHVNREYYCVECDTRFNSSDNLKIHFRKAKRHRDPSAFIHKCSECGEGFRSASLFCEHLTTKHAHEKLICEICNRQYSTKDSLRSHMRRHHSAKKPSSHVCTFCDKVFSQKSSLRRHSRVHCGVQTVQRRQTSATPLTKCQATCNDDQQQQLTVEN